MGHGAAPDGRCCLAGWPSLSVDVVSSVPGEMFTEMRDHGTRLRLDPRSSPKRLHIPSRRSSRTGTCSSSRPSTERARSCSRTGSARSRLASRPTSSCSTSTRSTRPRWSTRSGPSPLFFRHSNLPTFRLSSPATLCQAPRQSPRRSREDVQAARRIEEPHPRGRRAVARMVRGPGGSDLDRHRSFVDREGGHRMGEGQRRRCRRHAGLGRELATLCGRRS